MQNLFAFSSGSLSLKHYGHLTSTVPWPQQSHVIIASDDAPMYVLSWLINSPASVTVTLIWADILSLYVFKASCSCIQPHLYTKCWLYRSSRKSFVDTCLLVTFSSERICLRVIDVFYQTFCRYTWICSVHCFYIRCSNSSFMMDLFSIAYT